MQIFLTAQAKVDTTVNEAKKVSFNKTGLQWELMSNGVKILFNSLKSTTTFLLTMRCDADVIVLSCFPCKVSNVWHSKVDKLLAGNNKSEKCQLLMKSKEE